MVLDYKKYVSLVPMYFHQIFAMDGPFSLTRTFQVGSLLTATGKLFFLTSIDFILSSENAI